MEDEQSTSAADAVSTSTNDEVVDDGVSLEDTDISFEYFVDEDERAENAEAEEVEEDTEPDEEAESDEDADDEESEDTTEDTKVELSDQEKQKLANKEAAEKRIAEKRERDAEKAQTVKEEQQAYIADTEDPLESAVRQLQVDSYNNIVDKHTNTLKNDYQRALNDIEILRSDNKVVQQEVNDAVESFEARYVTFDKNGLPTEVRGDLYSYLQTKADAIEQLTGLGAKQQSQSKVKEQSKTLPMPSRAPKQAKVDPMLDAFDEEAKAP